MSDNSSLIELTGDIVAAYVSNNSVVASELPAMIRATFNALSSADAPPEPEAPPQAPAVPIRKSIQPDHIVCLEDGRKFKSLKRLLRTKYDLSPDQYRAKWGLPKDYPMVAPAYAEARSNLAKQMGLGQGGRGAAPAKPAAKAPTRKAPAKPKVAKVPA